MVLFATALLFTIQSHSYHQSKFMNSAQWLSGSIYNTSDNISSYFSLRKENKQLLDENKKLRHLITNQQPLDSIEIDSTKNTFSFISGRVIKNSYNLSNNYLTINKGKNHGIEQDMGVITSNGILGIVEYTSANFSKVQSILNTKSNINAKLQHTNYFGSLEWDTKDYNKVQLIDIPRLVTLKEGDTIVTGAQSSIFPENMPIGTIDNFALNASQSSYTIQVKLFQEMHNVKYAYIITNKNKPEILELESQTTNGQ
mgnify:CR=1 FL=1